MKAHGRVFWILRMMQWFWYSSDRRRERFVSICQDDFRPALQNIGARLGSMLNQ